jgi:dimethylargininase
MNFTHAIVRPPSHNFADGLTTAALGPPLFDLAVKQHEAYCAALRACGLHLTEMLAEPDYPDATFVEDTAVVTARGAIVTRPGAPSRLGEIGFARDVLTPLFPDLAAIQYPGTVEGGDVCEADGHFFIGMTRRSNEDGVRQLANWLAALGYTSSVIDLRGRGNVLHLKTELAYLGDHRLVVTDALGDEPALRNFDQIRIPSDEAYAANCVRVNDRVLIARGYPKSERILGSLGYESVALDLSEFRKMDGGVSCLSLRL